MSIRDSIGDYRGYLEDIKIDDIHSLPEEKRGYSDRRH